VLLMRSVRLFLDFEQDGRRSMEVYASELLSALRSAAPVNAVVEAFRPTYPFDSRGVWLDRLARYWSYPRQLRGMYPDLCHIIDHGYAHLLRVLPPSKTIVTVHDLTPIAAHRGKIPGMRRHRPVLSELSATYLNRAAMLIAPSHQTKSDLMELCGTPEDVICVVPLGVSAKFRPLGLDKRELRRKLGLGADDNFLILISGTHFYKNSETSLAVLRQLRTECRRDCKVLWVGNAAARTNPKVREFGLADHVIGIEPASAECLVKVYNACDCLLFPSLYEGFGWPALEAMRCGIPVVCSNAASLPEVVGDAALTCAPRDIEAFVHHIIHLMEDESLRATTIEKGLERSALYSWERYATAVWDLYEMVLRAQQASP
jgi:glycosyltransferase involved in cell wall biosynthesis